MGGASASIYEWLKDTITAAVDSTVAFVTGTGPGSATYLATGMMDALTSAVTSAANFGGGFVDGFLEALGIGDRGGGLWARVGNAIFGTEALTGPGGLILAAGQAGLVDHLASAFQSAFDGVIAAISLYAPKVLSAIVSLLPDAASLAVSAVSAAADMLAWVVGLLPTGSSFAGVVTTAADDILAWIGGILGAAWAGVIGLFSGDGSGEPGYDEQMLDALVGIMPSMATLRTFTTTAAADILSWLVGMLPTLPELAAFSVTAYNNILDWVADVLKSAWTGIEGLFTDGGDGYGTRMLDAVVGILPTAEQLGAALGTGIVIAVDLTNMFLDFLDDIIKDVWAGFKNMLGGGVGQDGSAKSLLSSVVDALKIAADFIFGSYFPFFR